LIAVQGKGRQARLIAFSRDGGGVVVVCQQLQRVEE
jgi:hypothetical protein